MDASPGGPPPASACSYCGGPVVPSAAFCPACGQERPGYGERFRRVDPPVVPDVLERLRTQGKPAVRVLLAIACALAVGIPAWLVLEENLAAYLLLLDALMAVAVTACALPQRRDLARLWTRGPALAWGLAAAGAFLLPLVAVAYLRLLGLESGEDPFASLSPEVKVLSICLMPGIFEEIAFRGVVLETALAMLRPRTAQVVTAALFAGIHFQPAIFPYHFLIGLLLGILRVRSGSLFPGMLAHALHNFAVVFVYGGG